MELPCWQKYLVSICNNIDTTEIQVLFYPKNDHYYLSQHDGYRITFERSNIMLDLEGVKQFYSMKGLWMNANIRTYPRNYQDGWVIVDFIAVKQS